jgi:cytochrome c biogenesis protein ResB
MSPKQAYPEFVKETLLQIKSHIGPHTSIPNSHQNRSPKQKLDREILVLTDIIDQIELTDVYRAFYQNTQ